MRKSGCKCSRSRGTATRPTPPPDLQGGKWVKRTECEWIPNTTRGMWMKWLVRWSLRLWGSKILKVTHGLSLVWVEFEFLNASWNNGPLTSDLSTCTNVLVPKSLYLILKISSPIWFISDYNFVNVFKDIIWFTSIIVIFVNMWTQHSTQYRNMTKRHISQLGIIFCLHVYHMRVVPSKWCMCRILNVPYLVEVGIT